MGNIRVYKKEELQYKKLKLFAEIVTDNSKKYGVKVKDIYFDMGQDWWYSGLVTYEKENPDHSWQSVCPRDYELILYTDNFMIMEQMAKYYAENVDEGKICIHLFEKF